MPIDPNQPSDQPVDTIGTPTPAPDPSDTPVESLKAGAAGVAEGVAGPLAPLIETHLPGVDAQYLRELEEKHPVASNVGKAIGLVGSAVTGTGELGLLENVSKGAAEALGLSGVAKTAATMGAANALYTLGDEASKAIKADPNTIQTAVAHVGLSGLLGAGAGAALGQVSKAWANNIGPRAEKFMNDFIGTLKGEEVVPEGWKFDPFRKQYVPPDAGAPQLFESFEIPKGLDSAGVKVGKKFVDYLSNAASESMAGGVGALAGRSTGIPGAGYLGAYLGHKTLKPLIDSYLPTIAERLLSSEPSLFGLKASLDTMGSIISGKHAIDAAADGLFKGASTKALDYLLPDKEQTSKLSDRVDTLSQNPQQLMELSGPMGYYMPDHQAAMASTAQRAIDYIGSVKPKAIHPSPLDKPIQPTPAQEASYQRTLQNVENPLSILTRLYTGRLQPNDIKDLESVYPALAPRLKAAVNNSMVTHLSNGNSVPLKMRNSLSLFLGQPMDTTLTPMAMQSIQATYAPKASESPLQPSKTKKGTSKLGQTAEAAQTPSQARTKALLKP